MKWYIPSWNGDIRLEAGKGDAKYTMLSVLQPTAAELQALDTLGQQFVQKNWTDKEKLWDPSDPSYRENAKTVQETLLAAPIEEVGPLLAAVLRPGAATMTAMTFKDGKVEVTSGSKADLEALAKAGAAAGAPTAATVKRPTPCCPDCLPGAVGPASEVLLSFLTDEEHAMWAQHRQIIVTGGMSGHRYRLAHRHTPQAKRQRRICWDLDLGVVVHFHDWTVPPEEEVLAAKLILEHREPWLRNEATMFAAWGADHVYKNPFGDINDGVRDANLALKLGRVLSAMAPEVQ